MGMNLLYTDRTTNRDRSEEGEVCFWNLISAVQIIILFVPVALNDLIFADLQQKPKQLLLLQCKENLKDVNIN